MLEVVSQEGRLRGAVRRIAQRLKSERRREIQLSSRAGRVRVSVQWRAAERFWWHLAEDSDRWHLVLGHTARVHSIESASCEINLRRLGADRRLAGAVLRDGQGELFLAHSGRVGGARSGADRSALRSFLTPGNWHAVRWPDGVETELHVVAHLGGPRFARQLGRFVREMQRFKDSGEAGVQPRAVATLAEDAAAPLPAQCDHGLLLDALDAALRERGLGSDDADGGGAGDLFAHRFRGQRRIVELAVDASDDAAHRLLGRLVARRAAERGPVRPIAVLPRDAPDWTESIFRRLEVGLVRFGWKGEKAMFEGLDEALG